MHAGPGRRRCDADHQARRAREYVTCTLFMTLYILYMLVCLVLCVISDLCVHVVACMPITLLSITLLSSATDLQPNIPSIHTYTLSPNKQVHTEATLWPAVSLQRPCR